MLSVSKRIWISFILILGIGLTLSLVISFSGDRVSSMSRDLIMKQFPRLQQIKALRTALTEHERLLYEYYATRNKAQLWPGIENAAHQIHESLMYLNEHFGGRINELPDHYQTISGHRSTLDANLTTFNTDWDEARAQLRGLTDTGEKVEQILASLTKDIESEVQNAAQETQNQIQKMVILVVLFSILIVGVSAFVGYYTQINLRETARRKALAMFPERNPNPVMSLKWDGTVRFANPACDRLLAVVSFSEQNYQKLLPEDFSSRLTRWQSEHQKRVDFISIIHQRTFQCSVSLFYDLKSCHLYMVDITEKQKAQTKLEFQAYHDAVTELSNRRKLELTIEEKISQSTPFILIFSSIDQFKMITTSQGYQVGDDIVKSLGQRLSDSIKHQKQSFRLFHIDRSQFCFMMMNEGIVEAHQLCEAVRQQLDEPLNVRGHKFYITLSFGICQYPENGTQFTELITNGHAVLNYAQRLGDHCEAFDKAIHTQEKNWLPIEAKMRAALQQKAFALFYQAKVETDSTYIMGAESLIRWPQEDGSYISPAQFIPVAEQTGLIIQIGDWVLQDACTVSQKIINSQLSIQIAINLSARQFQHRHFLPRLAEILQETHAQPEHIELEITESLIMENTEQSIAIMKKLKEMGFTLAIDDFGTGYSSLSYLKKFPIDSLKIDQSFIRNLADNSSDKDIVRAIIDLARHLNLKTIAEGVETQEQWQILKSMQCDTIQGYYFHKPMPEAQLTDLLKSQSEDRISPYNQIL